jgi:hypothetical protein
MALPANAVFPPPPVTAEAWSDDAWLEYWEANGRKTLPNPEEKERLRRELFRRTFGIFPSKSSSQEKKHGAEKAA